MITVVAGLQGALQEVAATLQEVAAAALQGRGRLRILNLHRRRRLPQSQILFPNRPRRRGRQRGGQPADCDDLAIGAPSSLLPKE